MKNILFALSSLFFLSSSIHAQVTWADDVAELFYAECTFCHNPDGIAPFSLLNYNVAAENADDLLEVIESGEMPPWTADIEYQDYAHERVLTEDEIQLVSDWVNDGALQGNMENAPPPPVFSDDGFITAEADLELQIELYTSNATSFADDYVCFSLPTGLLTDKKIKAFEVVPGNSNIVHHALVYVDPTGTYPTDTGGLCAGPTEGLIGGYTPGGFPTVFPSNGEDFNTGVTLPAGSNIVLAMHYPEGSAGETDASKIKLYFYDDEVVIREIVTNPIIQNWTFNIEAEAVEEVTADFNLIPNQMSVLSVFPHMHLIGHSIQSYAVTLLGDTIPFVNIPHWDFEWQEFLFFEEIQVLPAWSTIYGVGEYDNTSGNPHNPNDPPIDIGAGLNTSDEMFLVYFHYMIYEAGDELLDLEELTQLPTELTEFSGINESVISVYPNPVFNQTKFSFNLLANSSISLYIYDARGRLIEKVLEKRQFKSGQNNWDYVMNDLSSGLYYYSLNVNGEFSSGRIVKN